MRWRRPSPLETRSSLRRKALQAATTTTRWFSSFAAALSPAVAALHPVSTLDQAVSLAAMTARAGDVVLLSPAGTSFDAYANFESRGDAFRRAVQAIPGFREAPMH